MQRLDIAALYNAVEDKRWNERIPSHRALERHLGLPETSFLTRMSNGFAPNADKLITLLVWLDRPASDFAIDVRSNQSDADAAEE